MAALQRLDCNPLGRVMDKPLQLDGLLIRTEGRLDIHTDD